MTRDDQMQAARVLEATAHEENDAIAIPCEGTESGFGFLTPTITVSDLRQLAAAVQRSYVPQAPEVPGREVGTMPDATRRFTPRHSATGIRVEFLITPDDGKRFDEHRNAVKYEDAPNHWLKMTTSDGLAIQTRPARCGAAGCFCDAVYRAETK